MSMKYIFIVIFALILFSILSYLFGNNTAIAITIGLVGILVLRQFRSGKPPDHVAQPEGMPGKNPSPTKRQDEVQRSERNSGSIDLPASATQSGLAQKVPSATMPLEEPDSEALTFDHLRSIHERYALALIRPYPPRDLPKSRSHIGGLPSLPAGMSWPRAVNDRGCIPAGAPLHFLGQVDLGEQIWRPEHFPSSGTLLFFGALTDGYFWGTENDTRVIYDPQSTGRSTHPPEDLECIDGGYGDYQQNFGGDDWMKCRIFPEWPLVGKRIKTMPAVNAFEANAFHSPRYKGYFEAQNDFHAGEIARALGMALEDIEARKPPSLSEVLSDPGLPWTPRYVALWARWMLQLKSGASSPEKLRPEIHAWRVWADSEPPGSMSRRRADAFLAFLAEHGLSLESVDPNGRIVLQLVSEAGADPALAACLPGKVYEFAEERHRPINRADRGRNYRKDKKTCWIVRPHQMGGHVPSTQDPWSVDSDLLCLMQFQTDSGLNLSLSDNGEADFMMKPEYLEQVDFSEVEAETRGC